MKKHSHTKNNKALLQSAQPGFAGQDYKQGRGGQQSGHTSKEAAEKFNQFQNAGNGGYAAEATPNSVDRNTTPKK